MQSLWTILLRQHGPHHLGFSDVVIKSVEATLVLEMRGDAFHAAQHPLRVVGAAVAIQVH